ncbi:MAG: hypothetical protein ACJ72Z_12400 [Pyrinomonadaceae bacterium]
MHKFSYITSTTDEKATGLVSADYIAQKLANRTVSMISMNEDDTMFGFTLTDGGRIKFRLRPHAAEVVYYAPNPK